MKDAAKWRARGWLAAGAGLAVAAAAWALTGGGGAGKSPYRTLPVDRGAIVRAVTATGGLQPLVTIDVGSSVSGPVKSVEADFNAQVKAGQVLARLDPQSFATRVQQLDASLASAAADAAVARADWDRYVRLGDAGFASPQLLAQKRAALDKANAAVAVAKAQLASGRVDLDRTIIRSPVDGVVVDRKVEPGQSVAASFQAPTLFVIAKDLSALQAEIAVDEADIGEVREGQKVNFTVDAFPAEEFSGTVAQVRKQGAQQSGVVSYTVIVEAENRGGVLLPGMTANAEIVVEERPDVIRLPNAALRFTPGDPKIAALAQTLRRQPESPKLPGSDKAARRGEGAQGSALIARLADELALDAGQREKVVAAFQSARAAAGPPPDVDAAPSVRRAFGRKEREAAFRQIEPLLRPDQKAKLGQFRQQRTQTRATSAVVWVLRGGAVTPVSVRLGVASDSQTEVLDGLKDGDAVVVGGGPQAKGKPPGGAPAGGPSGGGPAIRIRGA